MSLEAGNLLLLDAIRHQYLDEDDLKLADELWIKSAKLGCIAAQSHCSFYGLGCTQDAKKAFDLALSGFNGERSAHCAFRLGVAYVTGEGVERDEVTGRAWFQTAADNKTSPHIVALNNLSVFWGRGIGGPKDETKAFACALKASEGGHRESIYRVGQCYWSGTGVDQNMDEACRFLKIASDKGHKNASYWMGTLYRNGIVGTHLLKSLEHFSSRRRHRKTEILAQFFQLTNAIEHD